MLLHTRQGPNRSLLLLLLAVTRWRCCSLLSSRWVLPPGGRGALGVPRAGLQLFSPLSHTQPSLPKAQPPEQGGPVGRGSQAQPHSSRLQPSPNGTWAKSLFRHGDYFESQPPRSFLPLLLGSPQRAHLGRYA